MKYKIIATDFDGTLLTNDKKVTDKTRNTLLKYKKENYVIIGITARNLSSVKSKLDIKMFDYLILNNGCYVYDIQNDNGTYVETLNKETVLKITNHFKDIAQGIDYISAEKYYMFRNRGELDLRNFVVKVSGVEEIQDYVARINIMCDNMEDVPLYKKYIDENFDEVDSIIMCDTDKSNSKKWIAINPKGLNKLTTLQKICNNLNISIDEAIFFGDSNNDIEIIQNVGLGVAMANALPEVKEKAKEITLSNDKDGVAYFLEKKLNNELKKL